MMKKPNFILASDALDGWRDNLQSGEKPKFFPIGEGELSRIEIGPGLITLFGGAPGAGKTAFIMQSVFDALQITPSLRAVVCNIEMRPDVLLDRQLSRLSGIDLDTVRYRNFTEAHSDRIDAALQQMGTFIDRLCFVRSPFSLDNVAATADEFTGGNGGDLLLVFDYIQRISPPGEHNDKRGSVDACMNYLRQFADAGAAVIVVAAVGRQKDSRGRSSYDGDSLNLASFRESSELEFGCDDAFILSREPDSQVRILRHLKARNTEAKDIALMFDGARQSFEPTETPTKQSKKQRGKLQEAIASIWEPTSTDDDTDDEDNFDRFAWKP
jgi:replicative DNA helicase